MACTFGKEEKLCSRRLIDQLYAKGHRLMAFPYSVQWMAVEADERCQVMIVAPKRKFKHAVDRNRIRRLTRECYRLQKNSLLAFLQQHDTAIVLSMVYIHNEIMPYDQLSRKMDRLLATLEKNISEKAV